jgi:hypothetical protein
MSKDLEKRIEAIEARNKKVESDKAWELSWTRRIAIMLLIYATVGVYLHFVVHISPWINGLVPVIGYFLSTVTIQKLKEWWTTDRG